MNRKTTPYLICSWCNKKVDHDDILVSNFGDHYLQCQCGCRFVFKSIREFESKALEQGRQILQAEIHDLLGLE